MRRVGGSMWYFSILRWQLYLLSNFCKKLIICLSLLTSNSFNSSCRTLFGVSKDFFLEVTFTTLPFRGSPCITLVFLITIQSSPNKSSFILDLLA